MVGVMTDGGMVTRVVDLRTGEDLLKIDNSRDADPPYSAGYPLQSRPGLPILFRKSDRFLALKGRDSVGLYGLKDGKLLREFAIDEEYYALGMVDPEERFFVDRSTLPERIILWEIDSGKKLWTKRPFPLDRQAKFSQYLDSVRKAHKPKRNFMAMLSDL